MQGGARHRGRDRADIVVTDINMPGLDGFALAAALRADRRTRHVPLLGMTGHWNTEMQIEAQRSGFSAMLAKPCMPAHLLAEVERVLRNAKLMSAALGTVTVGAEPALPVGLRNAVLRRRGVLNPRCSPHAPTDAGHAARCAARLLTLTVQLPFRWRLVSSGSGSPRSRRSAASMTPVA